MLAHVLVEVSKPDAMGYLKTSLAMEFAGNPTSDFVILLSYPSGHIKGWARVP